LKGPAGRDSSERRMKVERSAEPEGNKKFVLESVQREMIRVV
jgi:hypothetical protein